MDVTGTFIPHSDFGDPNCCGCLVGIVTGYLGHIICNECGVIVRTVPVSDLQKTLDEMELALDVAGVICPHCQPVNLFPGFTQMAAFTCQSCGRGVSV
jgi:hypothetical protein